MSDAANPYAEYARRRERHKTTLASMERLDSRLSNARLAVFCVGLIVAYFAFWQELCAPAWTLAPVTGFVALVIRQALLVRAMAATRANIVFYDRGIARIEDRWHGFGDNGARYLDEHHPYAADLDLFGPDSMYQLLCTAQTRTGKDMLAAWLTAPAESKTILQRQEACADLEQRLDLRENLAACAAEVSAGTSRLALPTWASRPPVFASNAPRWIGIALRTASVLAFLIGAYFNTLLPFAIAVVVEWSAMRATKRGIRAVLEGLEEPQRELAVLLHALRLMEREPFSCETLKALQARFVVGGVPASAAIDRLYRLTAWHDARGNFLFAPFAALFLWDLNFAYAFERWRKTYGTHLPEWLDSLGELEALTSLACYGYEHPADVFPVMSTEAPRFDGKALGHPIVPATRCVRNDVRLDGDMRLLLVSGSNMSGKSTLLRVVGINTVLALAGAKVRANSLTISPLRIGATLRVQDSIQQGSSRFYAEISRVKLIVDLTKGPIPVLFLLDEVFSGTNSHDRRHGAEAVIRSLLDAGAIGLVTTHDLALAHIAETLGGRARNVHFEDQIANGQLAFDYVMRDGIVQKSNAIELMRAVGLDV